MLRVAQVLRHQNADAIRAVRKAHPECSDKGGYDTIEVPEVHNPSEPGCRPLMQGVTVKSVIARCRPPHPSSLLGCTGRECACC